MLALLLAAAPAACALLTSGEVERVQGEKVEATKPSAQQAAELTVTQCFYQLPTFAKSVSLEVTRGKGVAPFWKKSFHEPHEKEAGEEGEAKEVPERVRGLGEEAFWTGSARLGGLYVLHKGTMLRLSVGGQEEKGAKLKKLRALARIALKRL